MKIFAFLLVLSSFAFGQITKTVTTAITATAGTTVCVLSSQVPALPTGVHAACAVGGANQLTMDVVIAVGVNGIATSFNPTGGGTVALILTQAAAGGPISYQITETPPGGPAVTASGTF